MGLIGWGGGGIKGSLEPRLGGVGAMSCLSV